MLVDDRLEPLSLSLSLSPCMAGSATIASAVLAGFGFGEGQRRDCGAIRGPLRRQHECSVGNCMYEQVVSTICLLLVRLARLCRRRCCLLLLLLRRKLVVDRLPCGGHGPSRSVAEGQNARLVSQRCCTLSPSLSVSGVRFTRKVMSSPGEGTEEGARSFWSSRQQPLRGTALAVLSIFQSLCFCFLWLRSVSVTPHLARQNLFLAPSRPTGR